MTLYRIKPFVWVTLAWDGWAITLVGSPYVISISYFGINNQEIYELRHAESDRAEQSSDNLDQLKMRAEQLWTEALLAALEPVEES